MTVLLMRGVPLGDVHDLVGPSDPRTTRLYERSHKRVNRNAAERIPV